MQAIDPFSLHYVRLVVAFYAGILWQAFLSLLGVLGTTGYAILVAAFIFVLTLIIKLLRHGIDAMRQHWKENLKDGVVVTLAVWVLMLILSFTRTIYENHRILSSSNETLKTELNKYKSDNNTSIITNIHKAQIGQPPQIINKITVNVSPPDRRIPAKSRDTIVNILSKKPGRAFVSALANDREAYQLALDIWGVLKDAGWSLPGGKIANWIGQLDPGITVEIHDTVGAELESLEVFGTAMGPMRLDVRTAIDNTVIRGTLRIYIGPRPPN